MNVARNMRTAKLLATVHLVFGCHIVHRQALSENRGYISSWIIARTLICVTHWQLQWAVIASLVEFLSFFFYVFFTGHIRW